MDLIPDDIILKYNLEELEHYGYGYVRIKKGMYDLKQAAILTHEQLVKNLGADGYYPIPGTAGIKCHLSH